MDAATSAANTPTTSNTDEALDLSQPCPLCGGEALCGGTGLVRYNVPVEDPRFGKLARCPHYRVNLDGERQEKLRKLSNLSAHADKSFDTFQTDLSLWTPAQRESLEYARRVAAAYARQPNGWLLLEGTYGCGKTHLAAAVGNHRLELGETVLFITSPDLLDYLRSTYAPSSDVAYDEMFDRVRSAPLLILDDLGVENPSAWAQEKLFQLLNHRYSARLPTVITTNADLDLLDPRLRSRLLDDNLIMRVRIKAPDYRTQATSQRQQVISLSNYAGMTFETFDLDTGLSEDDRANLERVARAAHSYAQQPTGWFVLIGAYGTGKTHLAAAIANWQQTAGADVVFVTVPDLLDYLRTTFDPNTHSSFAERFYSVRNAPLLVLDDLGTESATTWAKEKLFQIINHRYVANLPTVITSSRTVEEMDKRLASRLLDRRRCVIYAIETPPYVYRLPRRFGGM